MKNSCDIAPNPKQNIHRYYRPQTEFWGKVMFLHLFFCPGGSLYAVTSCLAALSMFLLEDSVPGPMFL